MIFQETAKIIANKKIAHDTCLTTLKAPRIARAAKPGQFVEVGPRVPQSILSRPMAIYDTDKKNGTIQIGYHIAGANTALYAQSQKNDSLPILGPLGSDFPIPLHHQRYVLVSGGIGITSLHLIGKFLKSKKKNVTTLIGARNKSYIACEADFKKFGDVNISTDDGSRGYKGYVHELLRQTLVGEGFKPSPIERAQIIYCGPPKMMESCAKVCNDLHVPHLAVMEEMMACGFGICVACVYQTTEGQKKVCIDGPIFDGSKIQWTRKQVGNTHE